MKKYIYILILLFCSTSEAATYYIRTDGGDTTECLGTTDAAYVSGVGQPCAYENPGEIIGWLKAIAEDDVVIINNGTYVTNDSLFLKDGVKVYGENWDDGCKIMPKIIATGARAFNLKDGVDDLDLRCLEITDPAACSEKSSGLDAEWHCAGVGCEIGLDFTGNDNVILRDINIHGMANVGIAAGTNISNFDVDRVSIRANGFAGWSGATESITSGTFTFDDFHVTWSGCIETMDGEIGHCYSQTHNGFGDGFSMGTGAAGDWSFNNSSFRNNVQDGLDIIHSGATDTFIIRNSVIEGNGGTGLKGAAGTYIVENNKIVGNCNFFRGKTYTQEPSFDHCRGDGKPFSFSPAIGADYYIYGNTIWGESTMLMIIGSNTCDGTETATLRGNVYIGSDYGGDGNPILSYHNGGSCAGLVLDDDYSVAYRIADNDSILGANSTTADPKLVVDYPSGYTAELMNLILDSDSPAIGYATDMSPAYPSPFVLLDTDFRGQPRTDRDAGYLEESSSQQDGIVGTLVGGTVK